MGFLKNFIKKYSALLPSLVILVVAGLLVLPTILIGSSIKKATKTSAGYASTIRGLNGSVMSEQQPEVEKMFQDKLESFAQTVDAMAVQSTQRDILDYTIFPEPTDTSTQVYINFGKRYKKAIEELVLRMKALDAPSQAEIDSRTGRQSARSSGGLMDDYEMLSRRRRSDNSATVDALIDAMCLERANEIQVYANPKNFGWYEFWDDYEFTGKELALEDCWYAQISYWVYEDIVETIKAINAGSINVMASPVKQLVGVRFDGPVPDESGRLRGGRGMMMMEEFGGYGGTDSGKVDRPAYITENKSSMLISSSPTTRMGDEQLDVIHFTVAVVLDTNSAFLFMKELCSEKQHTFRPEYEENAQPVEAKHNQITILQSAISAVDKQAESAEYYRYGDSAVVRLDLVCEYLFYRRGYDQIKPAPIRTMLGQKDIAGQAQDGAGGMDM